MVLPLIMVAFVIWLLINNRLMTYIDFARTQSGGASGDW